MGTSMCHRCGRSKDKILIYFLNVFFSRALATAMLLHLLSLCRGRNSVSIAMKTGEQGKLFPLESSRNTAWIIKLNIPGQHNFYSFHFFSPYCAAVSLRETIWRCFGNPKLYIIQTDRDSVHRRETPLELLRLSAET